MSGTQPKYIRHVNKQEIVVHEEEINRNRPRNDTEYRINGQEIFKRFMTTIFHLMKK